ncbi:MAG: polysaccharide biosynthesis/export family protein [Dysgonamonadaceae bacterium]|nr:polysaccharide biosynthesis/export family protein [Dysgonamonadaceae bacterium]MDD4728790.1 polysaccharide biosynthesis/export family protein [Dysgonamonadaceae bacterium]
MKKLFYLLLTSLLGVFLISCGSSKNVAYLQDDNDSLFNEAYISQTQVMYDAHIMPKDLLTITVTATEPEAVRPFNLVTPSYTSSIATYGQPQLQTYLVDNGGYVNFPVIGQISLGGLTKNQAEEKIKGLLRDYIKDVPIVTVQFVNYKISVVGEVARPNTFTIVNEKVNIFEALAMAGDMTIWGRRDNVKIIREDAVGNKRIIKINLNDKNVIFSDDFYLQQNDVVYVEPNKVKAQNSEIGQATSLWISGASILISIAGLVVNILR